MNILLFPVKRAGERAPESRRWLSCFLSLALCVGGAWATQGCGYHPLYGGTAPEVWCVRAAAARTPDAAALQSALEGARAELTRAGALGTASAYPYLTLELLAVQEAPAGISVQTGALQARARGSRVRVTGRAWVATRQVVVSRDTGDMSRVAAVASSSDSLIDAANHRNASVSAARVLGRDLARRLLGLPVASHDSQ